MGRLLPETIKEILEKHSQGVPVQQIAKEYSVDGSTVRYHVERFERGYSNTSKFYLVVQKVQKVCHHPSFKCLVCGVAHDSIHRRELEQIGQLTARVKELETILARYGNEEK